MFLRAHPVLHDIRLEVPVQVGEIDDHADDAAHDNAGEDDAELADVEAVDADVDEGEGLEERVVDAVDVSACVRSGRGDYVGKMQLTRRSRMCKDL